MSRRPGKARRWPPKEPSKGPPIVPPKGIPPKIIRKSPKEKSMVRMVKGRYKIVAGDRVIESTEVPTMVINVKEKKIIA